MAYEILSDPEKREVYDKFGIDGVSETFNQESENFLDLFRIFGRAKCSRNGLQMKQKNKTVREELKITLEQAYSFII